MDSSNPKEHPFMSFETDLIFPNQNTIFNPYDTNEDKINTIHNKVHFTKNDLEKYIEYIKAYPSEHEKICQNIAKYINTVIRDRYNYEPSLETDGKLVPITSDYKLSDRKKDYYLIPKNDDKYITPFISKIIIEHNEKGFNFQKQKESEMFLDYYTPQKTYEYYNSSESFRMYAICTNLNAIMIEQRLNGENIPTISKTVFNDLKKSEEYKQREEDIFRDKKAPDFLKKINLDTIEMLENEELFFMKNHKAPLYSYDDKGKLLEPLNQYSSMMINSVNNNKNGEYTAIDVNSPEFKELVKKHGKVPVIIKYQGKDNNGNAKYEFTIPKKWIDKNIKDEKQLPIPGIEKISVERPGKTISDKVTNEIAEYMNCAFTKREFKAVEWDKKTINELQNAIRQDPLFLAESINKAHNIAINKVNENTNQIENVNVNVNQINKKQGMRR